MSIETLFKERFKHISEDTSEKVNKKYFNKHYAFTKIPVVFRNAFQNWEIKTKWTTKYLKEVLKNSTQEIDSKGTTNSYILSEYLLSNNTNPDFYFMTQNHLNSKLIFDYSLPDFFKSVLHNL